MATTKKSATSKEAAAAPEMTGAIPTAERAFPGSQQDLYLYAALGWENYKKQQPLFEEKISPYFTAQVADEQLAFIDSVKAKPGNVTRRSYAVQARISLEMANDAVTRLFLRGKWHIARAWDNAQTLESKLREAGNENLEDGLRYHWASTSSLIDSFKLFLSNNATDLLANNNMLASFPSEFATAANDFEGAWMLFKQKRGDAKIGTGDKSSDNEKIYAVLTDMCKAGQLLFKNDELLLKAFTVNDLLRQVRGNKASGLRGAILDKTNQQPLANVRISAPSMPGYSVLTDEKGKFEFLIPSGDYEVEIAAEGYVSKTTIRTVKVGTLSRLSATLAPAVAATEKEATPYPIVARLQEAVEALQGQAKENGVLVEG